MAADVAPNPACARATPADALAGFDVEALERALLADEVRANARSSGSPALRLLHPRQRHRSSYAIRATRIENGVRGVETCIDDCVRRRPPGDGQESARRGRVQSATTRAPGRRSGPVPRARRCVEARRRAGARGTAVRRFRSWPGATGLRANKRYQLFNGLDQCQPDRLRSGRAAAARGIRAARAVGTARGWSRTARARTSTGSRAGASRKAWPASAPTTPTPRTRLGAVDASHRRWTATPGCTCRNTQRRRRSPRRPRASELNELLSAAREVFAVPRERSR